MSEKIVSKAVDVNGDGLDVWRIVEVGSEGTSEMVIDDSEIKFMYVSAYILKGLSKRHTLYICAGTYRAVTFKTS